MKVGDLVGYVNGDTGMTGVVVAHYPNASYEWLILWIDGEKMEYSGKQIQLFIRVIA